MKGTGRTVFRGETVESFDVEIVGLLPRIAPGQDLILGKCTGGPLAQTGILAGMSGSPVTIDGKLVGAIAYSWGFSKEAIAGITPIEEMLSVGARDGSPRRAASRGRDRLGERARQAPRPGQPRRLLRRSAHGLGRPPCRRHDVDPALGVRHQRASDSTRITPDLTRAGFLPLQSGAAGSKAEPASSIQPGSAIGVQLVRGDIDMTATGTVTWVDGDALYAFGHPLYGLGDVDLPLTAARVETLLPSLEHSAKIAVPLKEAGAFRQDRASGLFGRLGASPSMVPVRLQITDGSASRTAYAFDLVDDPLLTPILLYTTMNGIFGSARAHLRQRDHPRAGRLGDQGRRRRTTCAWTICSRDTAPPETRAASRRFSSISS